MRVPGSRRVSKPESSRRKSCDPLARFRSHHQTCTVGRQREGDGKTVHLKTEAARGLALHLERQPGDGRPGRRGHARPPELDTQSRARHEKKRRARNDRPHPPRPSNRARVPFGVVLLQLEPRVADVLEPVVRVLGQTSLQQLADAGRHAIGERAPVGLPVEDRDQRVARRLAAEGRAPAQRFVEAAAERPDVGAPVHGLTSGLLGAHVGRCPDDGAFPRRVGARPRRLTHRRRFERLREAEVQQLHPAVGKHFDVGRLQVAVDDAGVVRGLEAFGDLPADVERVANGRARRGARARRASVLERAPSRGSAGRRAPRARTASRSAGR